MDAGGPCSINSSPDMKNTNSNGMESVMVRDSAGDYSYIRRSRGLKIEIVEGESGVRNL